MSFILPQNLAAHKKAVAAAADNLQIGVEEARDIIQFYLNKLAEYAPIKSFNEQKREKIRRKLKEIEELL